MWFGNFMNMLISTLTDGSVYINLLELALISYINLLELALISYVKFNSIWFK